ncbi:MAG: tRNA pseudouridine(55) synthase TruB [Clostridia bacterium]|nr:tRNA pseudouridine(55) synthase TruB [Clostridia bacterium]
MNGIIIINKEKEYTSNDVVQIVKHTLNEKVGHTGTLDPNATGVLPILIGKGTKISKYLVNHDKIYKATLQLGIKTDTADGEGKILENEKIDKNILSEENINKTLKSFIGKQTQLPPIYSAIKVNGKKLYDYARNGEKIEVPARNIEIYNIKLNKIDLQNNQIEVRIECSKGTYIRTLCEDIAKKLGTIGYMKELNRIQVGEFNIEKAIKIQELKANKNNIDYLKENIISIEKVLGNKEKIILTQKQLEIFLNGVKIDCNGKDETYIIYDDRKKFIGTGILQNNKLKRDVII